MNIIKVLETEIGKWQDEMKCGLCWEFVPGGRRDYFNNIKVRPGDDCCVYVGVVSIRQVSGFELSGDFVRKRFCDWQVRIIAGVPSSLDIQFYNENPGHPASEGKWEKYIYPIFSCMGGCCVEMELCDIHNCQGLDTTVEPVRWDAEMVMNYSDYNLDGVVINATFREWYNQ